MSPRQKGAAPGALLLAPGAGADRDHHTLVALEEGLAPLPVHRMDFPYRKAGKRAPDRAPVAHDDEAKPFHLCVLPGSTPFDASCFHSNLPSLTRTQTTYRSSPSALAEVRNTRSSQTTGDE